MTNGRTQRGSRASTGVGGLESSAVT